MPNLLIWLLSEIDFKKKSRLINRLNDESSMLSKIESKDRRVKKSLIESITDFFFLIIAKLTSTKRIDKSFRVLLRLAGVARDSNSL